MADSAEMTIVASSIVEYFDVIERIKKVADRIWLWTISQASRVY